MHSYFTETGLTRPLRLSSGGEAKPPKSATPGRAPGHPLALRWRAAPVQVCPEPHSVPVIFREVLDLRRAEGALPETRRDDVRGAPEEHRDTCPERRYWVFDPGSAPGSPTAGGGGGPPGKPPGRCPRRPGRAPGSPTAGGGGDAPRKSPGRCPRRCGRRRRADGRPGRRRAGGGRCLPRGRGTCDWSMPLSGR